MASTARSMAQGMSSRDGSKVGKKLNTPKGFSRATRLFSDMARYFGGTWIAVLEDEDNSNRSDVEWVSIESQDDLNRCANVWDRRLSVFSVQVVNDAMAEIVKRGDIRAPSLATLRYLCQRITDEKNSPNNREAAKAARDRAMAKIRQGVIRG